MQLDDRTIKVIRWAAVLPVAFVMYCVMSAGVVVVGKVLDEEVIGIFGIVMLAPIAFTYAGSKTAPSH